MRPRSASVPSSRRRKSRIQSGISSVAMSATSIATDGTGWKRRRQSRRRPAGRRPAAALAGQGHQIALDPDEPVAGERRNGLGVGGLLAGRDGAQGGGPALAEGALERPLLAQRLVAAAPARARARKRADAAAGDAREAD